MANLDFDVFAASRGTPGPLSAGTVQPYKIAIIGDSYVDNTGPTDPKSFGYTFASSLRARYGDAGPGYNKILSSNSAGSGNVLSVSVDSGFAQYGK
jgi:hypothetical protein